MATTSRDAKLVLSVESLGQENISKLEKQLRDLAATGDASAAEFGALADQIARLGSQNDALQAVKTLSADTESLRAAQELAAQSAQSLATKLEGLRAATAEAKAAQDSAQAAFVAGDQAYVQAGNALRTLKAEYDATGRKTDEYKYRLQALVAEQNDARLAMVGLREATRQANEAAAEASAEQRKVESAYKSANAQYTRATTALDEQSKALREASRAAEELGVDTASLGDAEANLVATFGNAATAAQARRTAITEMAAADRLAAIEAKGLADLYARGASALQAETLGLRDAEKATQAYAAAKAKATADDAAWQREADAIVVLKEAEKQAAREAAALADRLNEVRRVEAFEKQAAAAQKLVQSAAYVRFWEQALDAADRKQADLVAGTQRLNAAFAQINVRPIEAVQQEIAATNAAMQTLAASGRLTGSALDVAMTQGQAKVSALEREVRQLSGTMTAADKAAELLKNSMGQIAAGNIVADAVGYLVNKVKEMGAAFIDSIVQIDTMRRGLNAIYKDAVVTATQIEFLRRSSSDAGVSFSGLTKEFVKFSAAMSSAQVPLSQSNALFAAITRSAGTLGLTSEETAGALNALGQMASKGTVSMEELRQQLGDRLPGAFGLVAKGLGITEQQLVKLVESGNLAARDLFPALTASLGNMKGEVYGLTPAFERLKGALSEVAQGMGDAGLSSALTQALKLLGGAVLAVSMGLSSLWEALYLSGKALEAWGKQISGTKGAWDEFGKEVDKSVGRLAGQGRAFQALNATADSSTAVLMKTASAMGATATAAVAAASGLSGVEKVATLQALAAKLAADNTLDLSAKLAQLNLAAADMLSSQQKQTEASEKLAKAAKSEGEALVLMAKLRGDEQTALLASATAANDYAAKLGVVAESHKAETEILKIQLSELDANAKARNLSAEAIKIQREALENKIKTSEAETQQSKASAEAARQEAVARRIAAESYADNSGKVNEYREAMLKAFGVLESMKELQRKGLVTDEQMRAAQDDLTVAVGRYNDALGDTARLQQAYADAMKSLYSLQLAGLDLELKKAQAAERMAILNKDEYAARKAQIQQREIEIKMVELKVKAMAAEAQGMLDVAIASRAELEAKNALTPVEQVRIANAIRMAEIKLLESKATAESVESMKKELQTLKDSSIYRDQNTSSIGREISARGQATGATNAHSDAMEKLLMRYKLSADYSEAQIALLEREAAAAEKAAEAYRKKWNVDKDGFSLDNNGQRQMQSVPTERYVYDTAKSQGLTEQEALALVDQFMRNGSPVRSPSGLNGPSKDWFTLVNEAINKRVLESARQRANQPDGGSTTPAAANAAAPAPTSGSQSGLQSAGKTVTVNIGSRSTSIRTASDADANALVGVIRQLETEAARSA